MDVPTVAVIKTVPERVKKDFYKVMDLAGLCQSLDPGQETIVKNNISWHLFYPSANTTPWQLEAVLSYLSDHGFKKVTVVQNETVVTNTGKGVLLNKYKDIYRRFGTRVLHNFKSADMRWTPYRPKGKMLVLPKIFPNGIRIPDFFCGTQHCAPADG